MYRLTFIIVSVILSLRALAGGDSATGHIGAFAKKLNSGARYMVCAELSVSGSVPEKLSIYGMGNKFALVSPKIDIIFDGTALWSVNKTSREVDVTEPTDEELNEVNPFSAITSISSDFRIKQVGDNGNITNYVLTPITDKFQSQVNLKWDKRTDSPAEISYITADGNAVKITLTQININHNFPKNVFVFNKDKYKNYRINDLR